MRVQYNTILADFGDYTVEQTPDQVLAIWKIQERQARTRRMKEEREAELSAKLVGACTIIIPVFFIMAWVVFGY